MRSIKEIYEMRERDLYPCQYPNYRDYGNTAKSATVWSAKATPPINPRPVRKSYGNRRGNH
jgi:hypothetical protein